MFKEYQSRMIIAFLVLASSFAITNARGESGMTEKSDMANLQKLANITFDSAEDSWMAEEIIGNSGRLPVTPADTPSAVANIRVQLKSAGDGPATSLHPHFKVMNIGDTLLNLSGLTLHYWFNCDCVPPAAAFEGVVDWARFMPSGLSLTSRVQMAFEPSSSGRQTHAMIIRFVSDSPALAPGQSVEIRTRFNRKDWGSMPPGNDWSYAPFSTFTGWNRVAGYINGSLVWGQEP